MLLLGFEVCRMLLVELVRVVRVVVVWVGRGRAKLVVVVHFGLWVLRTWLALSLRINILASDQWLIRFEMSLLFCSFRRPTRAGCSRVTRTRAGWRNARLL